MTTRVPPPAGPPAPETPLESAFFDTAPESDQAAVLRTPQLIRLGLRRGLPVALASVAAVLLAFMAWAGPWPASRADTPARVEAARHAGMLLGQDLGQPPPGPLRAAVGVHPVSPNPPNYVRLAGYTTMRRSLGVDGELLGYAVVLAAGVGPSCAIMGADLLVVTPDLAGQVATEVNAVAGIPEERILFTATHTHSAVGGYGRTLAEGYVLGAHEYAVESLGMRWSPAAWGVARDLRPATVRVAQARAPSLIFNRLDPQGVADSTVDVIQVDVEAEEPALLVLFGAHPTSEPRMDWMSPDYPGVMRTTVSEHVGAFVMFAAGAMGSMGVRNPMGPRNPLSIGRLLASPVMGSFRPRPRAQKVRAPVARVSCARQPLPLPPLRIPLAGSWALTERASRVLLGDPVPPYVSGLVAGPALVLSMPGELSGEVTLPLRERARHKGYSLAIASFSGPYAGYLLPARRFGQGVEGPLQLAGVGAADPAVAFIEGVLDALPQGPLPPAAPADRVWPPD
jgi:hypothetical protein